MPYPWRWQLPFNGSGAFSPPGADFPAVANTLIESAKFNKVINDIATGLTTCITKDGQTTVTANIPLGGNKITGLAAATARTDAASIATIQDATGVYVGTVGGTADVITLTPSPAITAYAAGQFFSFIASGANTTNVTVAISGLAAKAITKDGSTALVAGDIASGALVGIRYDGTQFQLVSTASSQFAFDSAVVHDTGNESVAGDKTFSGSTVFSGTASMSSKSMYWAKGGDLASADPLVVDTDGNYFDVTGTTGISSMTVTAGMLFMLQFDDALTLTHHATNLNLPGGANITTAAGDRMICFATGANTVHVLEYTRASGKVIVPELTSGTSVSASSTAVTFSSLPSGLKRINISLSGISTNGTSNLQIRIGDSGGIEATGYTNTLMDVAAAGNTSGGALTGFELSVSVAAGNSYTGSIDLYLLDSATNTWSMKGILAQTAGTVFLSISAGSKALTGTLDRVQLTTAGGSDTFDAGTMNILYE